MMATETSQTIGAWGDETFGPVCDLSALIARARLELDELAQAVAANDVAEIGREAADVTILLHRLAALSGLDLVDQVDAKMKVNRARTWRAAGDGTGAHV